MPGCGFSILPNRPLGKGVDVSELGERNRAFTAETLDILTECDSIGFLHFSRRRNSRTIPATKFTLGTLSMYCL
jgi:hypothetical protein